MIRKKKKKFSTKNEEIPGINPKEYYIGAFKEVVKEFNKQQKGH